MFWRRTNPSDVTSASSGSDRRRAERQQTAILTTELGPVLDVSRTGLRVSCVRLPPGGTGGVTGLGAEVDAEISSARASLSVRARVVRVKPVAGGRYEVGLELLDADDSVRDALLALASTGSTRPGGPDDAAKRERLIAALRAPDHYGTLGVAPTAGHEQIVAAYRAKARVLHPDVNPAPDAARRFAALSEAYRVLGDAAAREEYDRVACVRRSA
jgi:hypothetical protein